MKKKLFLLLFYVLFANIPPHFYCVSQTNYIGGGYNFIIDESRKSGLSLSFGTPRFCKFWPNITFDYGNYYRILDFQQTLKEKYSLQVDFKKFILRPSEFPFYLNFNLEFGVLKIEKNKKTLLVNSIGIGIGTGVVLSPNLVPFKIFRSIDCSWFIDLNFKLNNIIMLYNESNLNINDFLFSVKFNYKI